MTYNRITLTYPSRPLSILNIQNKNHGFRNPGMEQNFNQNYNGKRYTMLPNVHNIIMTMYKSYEYLNNNEDITLRLFHS